MTRDEARAVLIARGLREEQIELTTPNMKPTISVNLGAIRAKTDSTTWEGALATLETWLDAGGCP